MKNYTFLYETEMGQAGMYEINALSRELAEEEIRKRIKDGRVYSEVLDCLFEVQEEEL